MKATEDNGFSFETLSVNQGDFIIMTYDEKKVTCEELQTTFETVCQKIKHEHPVIVIKQGIQLSAYDKKKMIEFLMFEEEGNYENCSK